MAGPTMVGERVMWGTDSNTKYGMIQSISQSKGGNVHEYKDYQGDTKTLVISDKHDVVNLTAICTKSTMPPEVGEKVTISIPTGSFNIYVQSSQVDWSNEDATRITISGRTYPTISGGGGASA